MLLRIGISEEECKNYVAREGLLHRKLDLWQEEDEKENFRTISKQVLLVKLTYKGTLFYYHKV